MWKGNNLQDWPQLHCSLGFSLSQPLSYAALATLVFFLLCLKRAFFLLQDPHILSGILFLCLTRGHPTSTHC